MTGEAQTSERLYRLIYYSQNRIPGGSPELAAAIDAILAASRRNNVSANVTGALIFNSGIFAQALEGVRADLEATFERIQRDIRHGEVQVLAFEPTEQRCFPSWSMSFIGRSVEDQRLFGHIGHDTGFEARRMDGDRVFTIMRTIAQDEETSRAA